MPESTDFKIRCAELTDLETIVEFNSRLAFETEDKQLEKTVLTEGVRRMLSDPGKGRYFVATTDDGTVIGQVMFTHEWSDWRNGDFWWLQSVYVHANFRRRGIFRKLLQHVTELARADQNVVGLRLYVEEDNTAAQATYADLGFKNPGYRVCELQFEK